MKLMLTLMMALVLVGITACNATKKSPIVKLSDAELKQLCSKGNCEISENLKKRLILHSKELKLTPQEMLVLKKTGKVILCGDCGYLLNSDKYNESKKSNHANIQDEDNDGFADDSIRNRIIGPYIN